MISQVNPLNIIDSHLKTLGSKRPAQADTIDRRAVFIFFSIGIPFSVYQAWAMSNGYFLPAEIVGVVVSAAAIVAGLPLSARPFSPGPW